MSEVVLLAFIKYQINPIFLWNWSLDYENKEGEKMRKERMQFLRPLDGYA
jgi:hypothetical protein